MDKAEMDAIMKERIEKFNQFVMPQDIDKIPVGLFCGKMGFCIYFYHQTRYYENKDYKKSADKLLESLYSQLNAKSLISLEDGLIGICLGLNYLVEKVFQTGNSTERLGIIPGNPNGKIYVIKVCNPYCGPCANAHPIIDELIENNPDLQVQIIFTATGDENDLKTPPVQHLLAISENEDHLLTRKALDDWYAMEKKDYSQFAEKYPVNENLKSQINKIKAMYKWNEKEDIAFTPTFFINDYQLPEIYHVSDLKYFLSV